jgi:hypothetical protein
MEETMSHKPDSVDGGLEHREKRELVQTLLDLVSDLDEGGVQFLINQSRILIYNKQVVEINKKITASKIDGRKQKKKTAEVEKATKKPPRTPEIEIVERSNGKHFFIVARGFRIYFTLDEMKKLVKICHLADDRAEATHRLYTWFKRFRSDFLVDGGIGSARNPSLNDLYTKLISTYKVREDK